MGSEVGWGEVLKNAQEEMNSLCRFHFHGVAHGLNNSGSRKRNIAKEFQCGVRKLEIGFPWGSMLSPGF